MTFTHIAAATTPMYAAPILKRSSEPNLRKMDAYKRGIHWHTHYMVGHTLRQGWADNPQEEDKGSNDESPSLHKVLKKAEAHKEAGGISQDSGYSMLGIRTFE